MSFEKKRIEKKRNLRALQPLVHVALEILAALAELTELAHLAAARNRIRWFPGDVYRLEALELLDLADNILKELPVIVGESLPS